MSILDLITVQFWIIIIIIVVVVICILLRMIWQVCSIIKCGLIWKYDAGNIMYRIFLWSLLRKNWNKDWKKSKFNFKVRFSVQVFLFYFQHKFDIVVGVVYDGSGTMLRIFGVAWWWYFYHYILFRSLCLNPMKETFQLFKPFQQRNLFENETKLRWRVHSRRLEQAKITSPWEIFNHLWIFGELH